MATSKQYTPQRDAEVPSEDPIETSSSSAPSASHGEIEENPTQATVTPPPLDPSGLFSDQLPQPRPSKADRKKKAALDEERQLDLPLRIEDSASAMDARLANQRRSRSLAALIAIMLAVNLVMMGAVGLWLHFAPPDWFVHSLTKVTNPAFHAAPLLEISADDLKRAEEKMQARITELQSQFQAAQNQLALREELAKQVTAKISSTGTNESPTSDGRLVNLIADLQIQLQAAQKKLAENEVLMAQNTSRLKDLIVAVTAAGEQKEAVKAAASSIPGGVAMPSQPLTPTESELLLLKERNRLTAYADESIATGAREPYQRLWDSMQDPRLQNLLHAARAEILRVQNAYLAGSRIGRYDIPIAELFPDSATLRDTQLSDDHIIQLLEDQKQPWQTRVKAAWILGQRRNTKAGDALVKAVKEDPNLDVVKEATFSFEQLTGFHPMLFESALLEAWWKENNTIAPLKPKVVAGKADDKPAPPTGSAEKTNSEKEVLATGKP